MSFIIKLMFTNTKDDASLDIKTKNTKKMHYKNSEITLHSLHI